jgi:Spy/CpxP family protein refolding chaperone
MSEDEEIGREVSPRRRGALLAVAGALAACAIVGAALWSASGHALARPWGRGWGAEDRAAFARFRAERMLDKVGASEEQRSQVLVVVDRTLAELQALGGGGRELRDAVLAELSADQVDRAALERHRQQHVAMLESASRTLTSAIAEVAEILTPEQRRQLAELHRERFGAFHD